MTLTPLLLRVTCATLPKDYCVQLPQKYIKACGYNDPSFFKIFNQRSMIPRWPLTPLLLRSNVWVWLTLPMDHCVQVPWEYINVCAYSDQFCKTYHILHITYINTMYGMNDHIDVSFWTKFRRDKKSVYLLQQANVTQHQEMYDLGLEFLKGVLHP